MEQITLKFSNRNILSPEQIKSLKSLKEISSKKSFKFGDLGHTAEENFEIFLSAIKKEERLNSLTEIIVKNINHMELFDWRVNSTTSDKNFEASDELPPCDIPFSFFYVSMHTWRCALEDFGSDFEVLVAGFLVIESDPQNYTLLTLNRMETGTFVVSPHFQEFAPLVKAFFDSLRYGVLGFRQIRAKIRLKVGSIKTYHIIRRVIYMRPKFSQESYGLKTINWTHRFMVRGHWRVFEGGKGKDRAGERNISGFTWVRECEKGPEAAPLISKIRVVKGETNHD